MEKNFLKGLIDRQQGFVEVRYHRRTSNNLVATKGRVDVANHAVVEGVGVRALVDGAWGFAASADTSENGIVRAIEQARQNAGFLAKHIGNHIPVLRPVRLSTKTFHGPGYQELTEMPISEKLNSIIAYERNLASAARDVQTSTCRYNEIIEDKVIVTSDGACAEMHIVQPEISLSALAERNGDRAMTQTSAGVSGGWDCLYSHPSLNNMVDETAKRAVDLLSAKAPEGGRKTCILAPAVVGLLCHEAIGHTVEADFVKAGSVASGKIGQRIGSPLVSMADSGSENLAGYAVGNLPFDDEGVETETTMIIKDGILTSYLHNRETAAEFGVSPTGNARAWVFKDEPIIRMRNTYFLPGTTPLSEMIAGVDDGYLIEGAGGGQADSNGEFMFGAGWVWRIRNGKKTELLRKATLSGMAFEVLQTVDAVSQEFRWDLGTGYCGKGQPAKVDAGGPYVRCQITVGGEQR